MNLTRESEIEAYLVQECRKRGVWPVKFSSQSETGFPDRLLILNGGRIAWAELKRPKGGKLSPIQEWRHHQLRDLGFSVYVVKTKDEVDSMLSEICAITE